MNILVIGGTRYFGLPMVEKLLRRGDRVTIATRGLAPDPFGARVERLKLDLTEEESVRSALRGREYDAVIDKMGYCSNEMKWMLESLRCRRFVHMSTAGVYRLDHFGIREEEFDGSRGELVWCGRRELSYDDVKRNAERALCQVFNGVNWASLRVPFVLGENDYTRRLRFYVEHVQEEKPMYVDNLNARFCVAERDEVSDLLILLADGDYRGALNGCSNGVISIAEILAYLEKRTGKRAVLTEDGESAPYNGTRDNSLCTDRAKALGFRFREVHEWIFRLLDHCLTGGIEER